MKKAQTTLFVLLILGALIGCRRADIREITIEIPGLQAVADQPAELAAARERILSALLAYEGVKTNKVEWGTTDRVPTLTIQFDSMQIAEMNLRKAIEKAGLEVAYPELEKGKPAGYINTRRDEIRY